MATPARTSRLRAWLLEGLTAENSSPAAKEATAQPHGRPWGRVMCLTGLDYFSTLGYQPGIAALAAGLLSPLATIVLVLLTLFGALPVYRRVAEESPNGEGSIAMLERLLTFWKGKLFVLTLLGFAATDFLITITLSAADATAHLVENPHLTSTLHGHEVLITLIMIALLGAVFLKGFSEAIGVAVVLVATYLGLNIVVVAVGLWQVITEPPCCAPTRHRKSPKAYWQPSASGRSRAATRSTARRTRPAASRPWTRAGRVRRVLCGRSVSTR